MCLVLTAVVGSSIALVYAWQEKHMMDEMVSANVGDVVAMAELDISLLKQKGYVASYILDKGNKNWTEELDRFEPQLRDRLNRMEASSGDQEDRVLIRKVHDAFDRYTARRHEIVSLYDTGDTGAAVKAYLGELNETYFEAITAGDSLLAVNKRQILRSLADERREIRRLTAVMVSTGAVVAVLGFALVWLLFNQIFIPLRRIAMDMGAFSGGAEHSSGDDLASLHYHMRALLDEISRSRTLQRKGEDEGQPERLAAIGNAVAYIAHEIRNRLATIGGFAHALERHPGEPDRVREEALIIFQSSSRLEQMLAEVMEFSKPQYARRSAHSLNDLVRETLPPLAGNAPPGVVVETALDPSTPAVIVDPGGVEQVIINLVRNAIEALDKGGRILVSTRRESGGALLVVEDNGPGIPAEIRERIFEPFFTTKKAGSGLGLSICRKIISEQGADISIASEPGKGARFSVIFRNTEEQ